MKDEIIDLRKKNEKEKNEVLGKLSEKIIDVIVEEKTRKENEGKQVQNYHEAPKD